MNHPKIPQYEHEPFWQYMHRIRSLGVFHTVQYWEYVMIIYENLNNESRFALDSMSNFQFLNHRYHPDLPRNPKI